MRPRRRRSAPAVALSERSTAPAGRAGLRTEDVQGVVPALTASGPSAHRARRGPAARPRRRAASGCREPSSRRALRCRLGPGSRPSTPSASPVARRRRRSIAPQPHRHRPRPRTSSAAVPPVRVGDAPGRGPAPGPARPTVRRGGPRDARSVPAHPGWRRSRPRQAGVGRRGARVHGLRASPRRGLGRERAQGRDPEPAAGHDGRLGPSPAQPRREPGPARSGRPGETDCAPRRGRL